jgi:hypothetical protein
MKKYEDVMLKDYNGFEIVAVKKSPKLDIYYIKAPEKSLEDVSIFVNSEMFEDGHGFLMKSIWIKDVWLYGHL